MTMTDSQRLVTAATAAPGLTVTAFGAGALIEAAASSWIVRDCGVTRADVAALMGQSFPVPASQVARYLGLTI
jgi:hypothetical protein